MKQKKQCVCVGGVGGCARVCVHAPTWFLKNTYNKVPSQSTESDIQQKNI